MCTRWLHSEFLVAFYSKAEHGLVVMQSFDHVGVVVALLELTSVGADRKFSSSWENWA